MLFSRAIITPVFSHFADYRKGFTGSPGVKSASPLNISIFPRVRYTMLNAATPLRSIYPWADRWLRARKFLNIADSTSESPRYHVIIAGKSDGFIDEEDRGTGVENEERSTLMVSLKT